MLETVVAAQGASEAVLSSGVQEALGALVGAAREGLMALSVGVGLGVLAELMEEEVTEVVGPKGRHDPGRVAVRHGHDDGEVTLGGRRVPVERPRVRATDGAGEVPVSIYQHFASTDVMSRVVLERVLASVSMCRYQTTNEPVGSDVEAGERSTSKSAVSRMFIERTRTALAELMARRLDDVRLAVLMLDGIDLKERTHIRRPRDHHPRSEDPAGVVGRLHRERDRCDRVALRPRRAWPGPRAGHPVRPRRRQGATQGDPLRVR